MPRNADVAPSCRDYDMAIKIVLVGDSSVGKTSLLLKFTDKSFLANMISTIGVDFRSKRIKVSGKTVKMQIWDTAGQEQYHSITKGYYRGSHGALIVFDVTNRVSFENISKWLGQIEETEPNMPKILVANKVDSISRKVSEEEGKELAEKHSIPYSETSAMTGKSIRDVFDLIGEMAVVEYNKKQDRRKSEMIARKVKDRNETKKLIDLKYFNKHKDRAKAYCSLL